MAENQANNIPCAENTNKATQSSVTSGGRRRTWPELVGLSAEEAERKVKEAMGGARVQVVPPNCAVTMDFRSNRVRLYVDSAGKVVRPPTIG